MIVSSMTIPELRREMDRDFEIISRKAHYMAARLRKSFKPHGEQLVSCNFDYVSKHRNNWFYKVSVSKKNEACYYLCYFHNKRGFAATAFYDTLGLHTRYLLYFTEHFFERYNERCKLNLPSLKEAIIHFMDENYALSLKRGEAFAPGRFEFTSHGKNGLLLGTLNSQLNFIRFNTFLTYDMLTQRQQELAGEMSFYQKKYYGLSDGL